MPTAIKLENISKQYRLGQVGTGTISHDLNRWWHRVRGKEDPYSKIGQVNQRDQKADGEYVWALKDINLEVEQGEILGIIGGNGAGKSTLLKLISRITSPTTGSIRAKGRIASLLEVGTGMHPEMTARENIYLNGAVMGMKRHEIKRKFDDIVDFAGCAMYVDTPIKRYSSGMSVRLGFAVAAFLEPEILIVDEVLAVGDAEFQKRAIGKMKEVSQGGGRTVLFVSHNMGSMRQLTKRAAVLANGSVEYSGPTDNCISHYSLSYTHKTKESENVEAVARPFKELTRQVEFVTLRLLNRNKIITTAECIRFNTSLRVHSSRASIVLGLTISRSDGITIGGCFSERLFLQDCKLASYICSIDSHRLAPGEYSCGISIVDADVFPQMHDSLHQVLSFSVVEENPAKTKWHIGWGAIQFGAIDVRYDKSDANSILHVNSKNHS